MKKQFIKRLGLLSHSFAYFGLGVLAISCHKDIDYEPLVENISFEKKESGTLQRLTRIQFLDQKIGYISGQVGTLLKTVDAGNTWQPIATGKTDNWNSVHFIDETTGFLVANNTGTGATAKFRLFKTSDAGVTWQEPTIAGGKPERLLDIAFANATTGWMVSRLGQIYKSEDAGATWNLQTNLDTVGMRANYLRKFAIYNPTGTPNATAGTLAATSFNKVLVKSATEVYVTGSVGLIFKTIDGGISWKLVESGNVNNMNDIQLMPSSTLYTCGSNGAVAKIRANGSTEDITNVSNTRNYRSLHFVTDQVGWSTGDHGYIYKTSNGGKSWGKELFPSDSYFILYSMAFLDKQTGFMVGNNGTILKIVDASAQKL